MIISQLDATAYTCPITSTLTTITLAPSTSNTTISIGLTRVNSYVRYRMHNHTQNPKQYSKIVHDSQLYQ